MKLKNSQQSTAHQQALSYPLSLYAQKAFIYEFRISNGSLCTLGNGIRRWRVAGKRRTYYWIRKGDQQHVL